MSRSGGGLERGVGGCRERQVTCPDEEAGYKAVEGGGDAVDDGVENRGDKTDAVPHRQLVCLLRPLWGGVPQWAVS